MENMFTDPAEAQKIQDAVRARLVETGAMTAQQAESLTIRPVGAEVITEWKREWLPRKAPGKDARADNGHVMFRWGDIFDWYSGFKKDKQPWALAVYNGDGLAMIMSGVVTDKIDRQKAGEFHDRWVAIHTVEAAPNGNAFRGLGRIIAHESAMALAHLRGMPMIAAVGPFYAPDETDFHRRAGFRSYRAPFLTMEESNTRVRDTATPIDWRAAYPKAAARREAHCT